MALEGVAGRQIKFDEVLFVSRDGAATIGAPTVEGVSVLGEIVEQARSPKTLAFKKRRRQNSKRKRGHRQDLTLVQDHRHRGAPDPRAWRIAADRC